MRLDLTAIRLAVAQATCQAAALASTYVDHHAYTDLSTGARVGSVAALLYEGHQEITRQAEAAKYASHYAPAAQGLGNHRRAVQVAWQRAADRLADLGAADQAEAHGAWVLDRAGIAR